MLTDNLCLMYKALGDIKQVLFDKILSRFVAQAKLARGGEIIDAVFVEAFEHVYENPCGSERVARRAMAISD